MLNKTIKLDDEKSLIDEKYKPYYNDLKNILYTAEYSVINYILLCSNETENKLNQIYERLILNFNNSKEKLSEENIKKLDKILKKYTETFYDLEERFIFGSNLTRDNINAFVLFDYKDILNKFYSKNKNEHFLKSSYIIDINLLGFNVKEYSFSFSKITIEKLISNFINLKNETSNDEELIEIYSKFAFNGLNKINYFKLNEKYNSKSYLN